MSDTPENQYKAPGDLTPVKWYASPTRRFLGLVLYVLSAGFGCAAILLLTRGLRYLLGYTEFMAPGLFHFATTYLALKPGLILSVVAIALGWCGFRIRRLRRSATTRV